MPLVEGAGATPFIRLQLRTWACFLRLIDVFLAPARAILF
jgi:hypothetical protein